MTDRNPKTAPLSPDAVADAGNASVARLLQSAVAMHQQGQLDQALALYREVLSLAPRQPDAVCLEGTVLLQRGELEAARLRLAEAVRLNPRNPDAHSNHGHALRQLGETEAAVESFRQALVLKPHSAEALNNLGIALATTGESAEAETLFGRVLTIDPSHVSAAFNLSKLLQELGRRAEAIGPLEAIVANTAAPADIHNRLGVLYQQSGNEAAAETSYRRAIAQDPRSAHAHNNLGTLLHNTDRREEALSCFQAAVALAPGYKAARRNLGLLLQALGAWQASAQAMEELCRIDPEDQTAQHVLAALRGQTTPRAPHGYLKDMFDSYAASFEQYSIDVLNYRAPEQLRQSVDLHLMETGGTRRFGPVLDMGCGTGLVARAFQDVSDHVVGIDLAPKMVEAARASGLYAEVFEGELEDFFAATADSPTPFDLVLSADLFIYIGDIEAIVRTVAERLSADGLFAFSVEHGETTDFELRQTGRYAQSEAYVRRLARQSGLEVARVDPVVLREEKGQPVDGRVYVLKHDG